MTCYNVYDRETKVLLGVVTLHSSATSDDVARAACQKVNRQGYNLSTVKDVHYNLIIEVIL